MKEVIKKCEEKMTKTCENLDGEFANIRAGRANPNLLNRIMVEYYGTPTPMQQVGNISVPEPRIIQKAILASDLGITPTNDGTSIRLVFPELTEERRKELVKDIKKKGEAAKVAVRNVRRDANDTLKKMEKSTDITEDERKEGEEKIQKMTDKYVAKIDKSVENKSKEIMTV